MRSGTHPNFLKLKDLDSKSVTYKPISLLSNINKLLEKLYTKNLFSWKVQLSKSINLVLEINIEQIIPLLKSLKKLEEPLIN